MGSSVEIGEEYIVLDGRRFRADDADGKQSNWAKRKQQRSQKKEVVLQCGSGAGGPASGGRPSSVRKQSTGSKERNVGLYKDSGYKSKPKGPWVACQNAKCPGHNRQASFKFICDIGKGANGLACMGCQFPWADSLRIALEAGQLPRYREEARGHDDAVSPFGSGVSAPAVESGKGQKPGAPLAGTGESRAFAKLDGEESPFRQLPKQAIDACPEQLRATLSMHLLRKAVPAEQIAKLEQMAAEGQEVAKAFMAAVAIALPYLEAKPLPKTAAPKVLAKDQRSPKLESSLSYSALQAALSESQRAEAAKHKVQSLPHCCKREQAQAARRVQGEAACGAERHPAVRGGHAQGRRGVPACQGKARSSCC